MANTGSTAETICSAPAREKEETIFYLHFFAFPTEVEKSFERSEPPSFCLCEAKVAVDLLFDSSAWALELIILLPAALIWVHACASVSASC